MTKSDFAAYVFYVNRPELLRRAISSFPDLISELTVVNNSGKEIPETMSAEECVECCFKAKDVFDPHVPLTYAQSMNWMLKDALSKKVDFILHFHSDASSTNEMAVSQLLAYARDLRDNQPFRRWACLYTLYDVLWLINPLALHSLGGWDTNFPTYFGDQDFTHRLQLAGWERINTGIEGITHTGSSTINATPQLKYKQGKLFGLHATYYREKWGGDPGEEQFSVPFNRPDLFGEISE